MKDTTDDDDRPGVTAPADEERRKDDKDDKARDDALARTRTGGDSASSHTPARSPVKTADADRPHHPPDVRFKWRSACLVLTCTTAMILNISSSTAVSIALPTIGRDFNVAADQLQWLVSAFSLSSGCLLIPFGRLADLHGRRRAFLLGTLWLGVLSLGCGFAQNVVTLDVLRALAGMGPAATIPASLGILAHAFPPSRARSIAFATFSAGAPVGGAVGMQIGGVLTQYAAATWRAQFFLCAGLSVPILLGGLLTIAPDAPSTEPDTRVDWLGAALVTSGLVLVTFVLGQGSVAPAGWRTPYIIALLVVGVLLVALFLCWQHRLERIGGKARPPLMKLSLWARAGGRFAVMQCIAFLEWAAFLAWGFWAQLYYQEYEMLSPVQTAVRMLPMMIVGVLCNFFVAMVVGHVDMVILVACGTTLTGLAALLFALIKPAASYWAFGFPAAMLSVFGADFVFACGTLFVAKVSLPHEQSLAGGLFQTLMQLGTAFGLAITTIVNNAALRRESAKLGIEVDRTGVGAPREAQLEGYRAAQWTAFGFALFGTALAVMFLRDVGVVGHRRRRQHDEDSAAVSEKSASASADTVHSHGASPSSKEKEDGRV